MIVGANGVRPMQCMLDDGHLGNGGGINRSGETLSGQGKRRLPLRVIDQWGECWMMAVLGTGGINLFGDTWLDQGKRRLPLQVDGPMPRRAKRLFAQCAARAKALRPYQRLNDPGPWCQVTTPRKPYSFVV
jgi:hypothetical protein